MTCAIWSALSPMPVVRNCRLVLESEEHEKDLPITAQTPHESSCDTSVSPTRVHAVLSLAAHAMNSRMMCAFD